MQIIVRAHGEVEFLVDITEALAWLCAAKRISAFSKLAYSESILGQCSATTFQFHLKPLEPLTDDWQKSCWHNLFKNAVIVRHQAIPARKHGEDVRGLEISFQLITFLLAVVYFVKHNEGYILIGFSTIISPTTKFDDGSIQWHLTVSDKTDQQILLPPRDHPLRKSIDVQNFEELRRQEHSLDVGGLQKLHLVLRI
jgi:hypothetical protein